MQLFELTRALVDIESVSGNEKAVGDFLYHCLLPMAQDFGGQVERMDVAPARFNVFAHWGSPEVVLSSHMDTVPPFLPSREDREFIWGRGACDAKGIIASMMAAAESLLGAGGRNFGLLFLVGEERNSAGAQAANGRPRGSRYLINGEPTENRLALGSKGALRLEIEASGKMAHSAYPELGESAIQKLLAALAALDSLALPADAVLGEATWNIGTISGGRAPNVIPDSARAELMVRLVTNSDGVKNQVFAALGPGVSVRVVLDVPPVRLGSLPGIDTTIVKFTTDIPKLTNWGRPFLLGPGSIHVAHTTEERVSKEELLEAARLYRQMVERLQHNPPPEIT